MDQTWTCSCCGQTFDTLPMDYAVSAPRQWLALPQAERESRGKIDADLCRIDGTAFYVRGCLEVLVLDSPENLVWGVWASVSEASFRRILDLWTATDLPDEPPSFGWFDTWLNGYPEPVEIKCQIRLRVGNLRPLIELQDAAYPLAVEQRDGITLKEVKGIAARMNPH